MSPAGKTPFSYYNEIDPFAAAWLRELIKQKLIPEGNVDERDIREVQPGDVAGYAQAHFFAGIGGWPEALRLAGWSADRPVWTGSCPCQPFSQAGKRRGEADPRHLWPEFRRLIAECRPAVVFGEQVAVATEWLATVRSDLEALGYAVGAMPIEAASVGAPHKRDRFWFVADSDRQRQQEREECNRRAEEPRQQTSFGYNAVRLRDDVANPSFPGLSVPKQEQLRGTRGRQEGRTASQSGWWSAEPNVGRVAHGISAREGKLRALGNAIVPQVAAEFILAATP